MHLLSQDADLQICPDLFEKKLQQRLRICRIFKCSFIQNFSTHFAFNIVKTETRLGSGQRKATKHREKTSFAVSPFFFGYSSLIGKGMCLSLFENCVMQFFTDTIAAYLSHSTKKTIEAKREDEKAASVAKAKKKVFTPSINSFYGFFSNYLCRLHSFLSVFVNSLRIVLQGLRSFHYYTQYFPITQIVSLL